MARFSNNCSIMLDQLTLENAYLVKVPQPGEKIVTYYYIGDIDTIQKLKRCPKTRRTGEYYAVKLSTLNKKELAALLEAENTLIEDNDKLRKFDQSFSLKWKKRHFSKAVDNPQQTSMGPVWLALSLSFSVLAQHGLFDILMDPQDHGSTPPENLAADASASISASDNFFDLSDIAHPLLGLSRYFTISQRLSISDDDTSSSQARRNSESRPNGPRR